MLILSCDDPYDRAEVRGRVVGTVTADEARRHIHELHRRYEGGELADCAIGPQGRVIHRITPDKINTPEKVPGHPPRASERSA